MTGSTAGSSGPTSPHLKKNFADQLCEATGGPCAYTGRSMREAHDAMRVTAGEFDAFNQDLEGVLDEFNVPPTEHRELLGLLLPLRERSSRSSRQRRGPAS
ncbi:MAG: group 1 truncated hemoglobin [Actinomycetes bacterium]